MYYTETEKQRCRVINVEMTHIKQTELYNSYTILGIIGLAISQTPAPGWLHWLCLCKKALLSQLGYVRNAVLPCQSLLTLIEAIVFLRCSDLGKAYNRNENTIILTCYCTMPGHRVSERNDWKNIHHRPHSHKQPQALPDLYFGVTISFFLNMCDVEHTRKLKYSSVEHCTGTLAIRSPRGNGSCSHTGLVRQALQSFPVS